MSKKERDVFSALKKGEPWAFEWLYKNAYRKACSFVLHHFGNESDAEDCFQEALFVLVKKLRDPAFEVVYTVDTYLYAIVRNIWLKRQRDRGAEIPVDEETMAGIGNAEGLSDWQILEEAAEKEARFKNVLEALGKLGQDCRDIILKSYYEDWNDAEIAKKMEYQLAFVRVKRFRCMSRLREILGI